MKDENKLDCPKCEKKVRILFKMGGLICSRCRTIVEEAYSVKWLEFLEASRKQNL
jgi:ribosomal protein L37AE/L43A